MSVNQLTHEIACWRAWNYIKVHDKPVPRFARSIGVTEAQFDAAMDTLKEVNCVEMEDGKYKLVDDRQPPMTSVFPTITNQ